MTKTRTTKYRRGTFNFKKLITALGGDSRVSRLLNLYGYRPANIDTIQKWKARNSIPAGRFADLLGIASEEHVEINIEDLLVLSKKGDAK